MEHLRHQTEKEVAFVALMNFGIKIIIIAKNAQQQMEHLRHQTEKEVVIVVLMNNGRKLFLIVKPAMQ